MEFICVSRSATMVFPGSMCSALRNSSVAFSIRPSSAARSATSTCERTSFERSAASFAM